MMFLMIILNHFTHLIWWAKNSNYMQLRGGGTDLLRGRNNFHNTVIPCLLHQLETLLPKMTRKLKPLALTMSLGVNYGEGYHKLNNYWVLYTTSSLLKEESTLKTKNSYTEISMLCIIILEITSPNTHLPFKKPNSRMWFWVWASIGFTFILEGTF